MIFIGGVHRSGTTFLADQLAIGSDVAGLVNTGALQDEGHWLHDVVPSANAYGGVGRFAFDTRSHLVESHASSADPDAAERMLDAWEPFWSVPSAPVRVEKSPQYVTQMRFMQGLFPSAQLVLVMRHPAAVAMASRSWLSSGAGSFKRYYPSRSPRSLIRHWIRAHQLFAEDRPHLENITMVRFEELAADPEGTLASLRMELGLDLVDPSRTAPIVDRGLAARWMAWRSTPGGRVAERTWLHGAYQRIAEWGYRFDDEFI